MRGSSVLRARGGWPWPRRARWFCIVLFADRLVLVCAVAAVLAALAVSAGRAVGEEAPA